MLRLSAAGRAALQGTALLAPVVTPAAAACWPATAESQLYSTLLKTWWDGLIARQMVAMRPGFEAVPLIVAIHPGNEVSMRIEAGGA